MLTGGGSDASRPVSSERTAHHGPHWWTVLAVALALMSLVAAVSAHARRLRPASLPRGASASAAVAASGTTAHPGSGPATTGNSPVPTRADAGTGSGVSASVIGAGEPGPGASGTPGPVGIAATTTVVVAPPPAPTTVAPDGSATTVGATTTTSLSSEQLPGNLTYPDDISAEYVVGTSGPLDAQATWASSNSLTLSVDCPGATRSATGPTGLRVALTSPGTGSCTVTLAEPAGTSATISYVLDVAYQAP